LCIVAAITFARVVAIAQSDSEGNLMPTPEQIAELFAIHNSPERRRELLLRSYGFDDSRT
jgi:hypothetical protein